MSFYFCYPVLNHPKKLGVDAVIFSGGKTLRGPGSTGFIVGRQDIIESCRFHTRPNYGGIGFAGKVSKEEMVGLYIAVKLLVEQDEEALHEQYRQQIDFVMAQLKDIRYLNPQPYEHGVWGDEFGVHLYVDDEAGIPPNALYDACVNGDPYIEVGPRGTGIFISVSTLRPGEERIVIDRILETLREIGIDSTHRGS